LFDSTAVCERLSQSNAYLKTACFLVARDKDYIVFLQIREIFRATQPKFWRNIVENGVIGVCVKRYREHLELTKGASAGLFDNQLPDKQWGGLLQSVFSIAMRTKNAEVCVYCVCMNQIVNTTALVLAELLYLSSRISFTM